MRAVHRYRGRIVTAEDILFIRQLIAQNPGLSRRRLSAELCEAWDWKQTNGALRDMVCRGLLLMLHRAGEIELELVPQGNLAARIEAAGAGLGAIFTPTGYGTLLAEGKETREIAGRQYVLEYPIHADFALVKACAGDRWGNLVYRKAARNFGPIMARAAKTTVAQVAEFVPLGSLNPEAVATPGIFVNRIVLIGPPAVRTAA